MTRPRIRHLALYASNPEALTGFYREKFGMEVIMSDPDGNHFLSDGYLTLAVLKHQMAGEAPLGLNHFGFHLDDVDGTRTALTEAGLEEPALRASKRPYAEYRAIDPEGNWFDLSEHGYGIP
ncbi:VOC family protein [Streptomyces sp. NBC_01233]|uniref:VOC family protein n=1 Tax=Streptomyces sp. NBC_01233 TaxID=2903787 RepID=UPI002E102500|nr:VOC family protein [Streptomyces sp. NBC_01233]